MSKNCVLNKLKFLTVLCANAFSYFHVIDFNILQALKTTKTENRMQKEFINEILSIF